VCQQTAQAQTNINADTAQLTSDQPTSRTTDASAPPPNDPAVAALNQQADTAVAQGHAIAAATQTSQ
jgi:hypothetical protein